MLNNPATPTFRLREMSRAGVGNFPSLFLQASGACGVVLARALAPCCFAALAQAVTPSVMSGVDGEIPGKARVHPAVGENSCRSLGTLKDFNFSAFYLQLLL